MNIAPSSAASRGRRAIGSRNPEPVAGVRQASGSAASPAPGPAGARFDAHELEAELGELLGLRLGRRLEHEVAARLRLREGHDLADVGLLREEGRPAVDAERDPAVRRRAELERVEHRPELLVHRRLGVALEREALDEQVVLPDPHGAAAQLPAVEHDVVLHRAGLARGVARRGPVWVAVGGDEQRLVLRAARRRTGCGSRASARSRRPTRTSGSA